MRGHDESPDSKNRGNSIEMIKLMGKLNVEINDVVLEKAPKNAKYTSPTIQKEILHILANKMITKIREEIGDAKFYILVDEAKDASNREQMAIVLRFVDVHGFLREHFFEIVHVTDTVALTLKKEIYDVLVACYNLNIENMRGQGYDGASNMHGNWNGLQALFLRDSPSAYYCFSKCHAELQDAQAIEIERTVTTVERVTGRGANQIGTLHRAGTTRWSSHFNSMCSLIDMYGANIKVLENMVEAGTSNSIRGEAGGDLIVMRSFEFEMHYLRCQLEHYEVDVLHHQEFQNMSTISELCRRLVETNKSQYYYLIDRLIRLVLTLPVTTATTERAFSAMKHVKTALRNKMEDEFLADSMIIYIKRELLNLSIQIQ
ncbi:uncharacterized protein LOC130751498 [Actinidia eriantha]|uniref:uncharacterized protein LOC130751498 n=1 Tax=Actinidia eriantha TaxID=165200 RepID=UPI00258E26C1|nr:uncharacterized protein LOC130751498 [Actinidia eriantha]